MTRGVGAAATERSRQAVTLRCGRGDGAVCPPTAHRPPPTAHCPMRLAILLLVLAAAPVRAQMLPSGTWTGQFGAGRSARPATALIERCATGFRVDLTTGGRTARTETATYRRGQLAFEMSRFRLPGSRTARPLACELEMDPSGHLSGACTSGRTSVPMRLAPPADGALGCE